VGKLTSAETITHCLCWDYGLARRLLPCLREKPTWTEHFLMIQLTDSALSAVRSAIAGAGPDVEGLRIMVEAGGCAGFKYMMGLVNETNPAMC